MYYVLQSKKNKRIVKVSERESPYYNTIAKTESYGTAQSIKNETLRVVEKEAKPRKDHPNRKKKNKDEK